MSLGYPARVPRKHERRRTHTLHQNMLARAGYFRKQRRWCRRPRGQGDQEHRRWAV